MKKFLISLAFFPLFLLISAPAHADTGTLTASNYSYDSSTKNLILNISSISGSPNYSILDGNVNLRDLTANAYVGASHFSDPNFSCSSTQCDAIFTYALETPFEPSHNFVIEIWDGNTSYLSQQFSFTASTCTINTDYPLRHFNDADYQEIVTTVNLSDGDLNWVEIIAHNDSPLYGRLQGTEEFATFNGNFIGPGFDYMGINNGLSNGATIHWVTSTSLTSTDNDYEFYASDSTEGNNPILCSKEPTFSPTPTPTHPVTPTTKYQCKKDQWMNFVDFKNQGACVSFVEKLKLLLHL